MADLAFSDLALRETLPVVDLYCMVDELRQDRGPPRVNLLEAFATLRFEAFAIVLLRLHQEGVDEGGLPCDVPELGEGRRRVG